MRTPGAGIDAALAVADAILYEGYLLYPYRRSSGKNRVRWQFGLLLPPEWARAHGLTDEGVAGSAESWWQQTECLLEAPTATTLRLLLRFLQVQRRSVEERLPDGAYRPVDTLQIGDRIETSFDEAVPRRFEFTVSLAELLRSVHRFEVSVPEAENVTPLSDPRGELVGRVTRRCEPVTALVTVSAAREEPPALLRLTVRTENTDRSLDLQASREAALRRGLIATHTLLSIDQGRFLSQLDPPAWAASTAERCRNVHTFPVLAGPPGNADLVLSSPIILYDHPRIAPESPGDLHDATEIDEILSLRTLTLTDAEKREAHATDPRAAEIIDRVDTMPPEVFERLHGAIRSLRPVRQDTKAADPAAAWWEQEVNAAVSPDGATVTVAGVTLGKGSRVRLRPRARGTDAHDMFLDGRTGRVEKVLVDVDGTRFLAVTVDDDPGADLHHWYGRLRHFRPEEVEPLPSGEVAAP